MTEFVVLILFFVFNKLADTLFNLYQVKIQYDVEKLRIKNEKAPEESEQREIGFNTYGNTMTQVEEYED